MLAARIYTVFVVSSRRPPDALPTLSRRSPDATLVPIAKRRFSFEAVS